MSLHRVLFNALYRQRMSTADSESCQSSASPKELPMESAPQHPLRCHAKSADFERKLGNKFVVAEKVGAAMLIP